MIFSKRSALLVLAGAFCALGLLFGLPYKTQAAETGPDWMNGSITVTKLSDYNWTVGDQAYYGNIPCQNVGGYEWGYSWTGPKRVASNRCAVSGATAYITKASLRPFGDSDWQYLDLSGYFNFHPSIFLNPGTDGFALVKYVYKAPSQTSELYYTNDILDTFHSLSHNSAGTVVRSQSKPFEYKLTYANGEPVSVTSTDGLSFSANGRWMYVGVATAGQLRIDTKNFAVFSFASGYSPMYATHSSISNSGNTAVTYSQDTGLKLYDLTRCEAEKPDYRSRDCATREVMQAVRDELAKNLPDASKLSQAAIMEIKFLSESRMRLLIQYIYEGRDKYMFMSLSTEARESTTRYLALGDSFSSGEGVGNYYEATNFWADENNYNFCHQSHLAYSELLNKWLSSDFYDSAACSGAQIKDVVFGADDEYINSNNSQARSDETTVQLIQHVRQSNLPGYVPQLSLIQENSPNIATISIGGNDIGFKDIIMSCVTNLQCYQSRDDKEKLADLIASKLPRLAKAFATIKQNLSGANPKLYVLGYPQLFAERSCGHFMTIEEQIFANHLVDYLNATIQLAATQAGVFYIDVTHAFSDSQNDYRLCSKDIPAVNGVFFDANNMPGGPLLSALSRALVSSYHPNELGHRLLASAIRQQTDSLSKEMPIAGFTDERPSLVLYEKLVGDVNDGFQELGNVSQDIIKDIVVERGQSISVSYSLGVDDNGLPVEDAMITVVAQSTPVILGTMVVQSDGTANGNFTIPSSLEPGMHTLHLLYTDMSGQSHDVYQYVYVIANQTDFDGDGIPNDKEECVLGGTMGIDRDDDGIDDACDTNIAVNPVQTEKKGSDDTTNIATVRSDVVQNAVSPEASSEPADSLIVGGIYFGASAQMNAVPGYSQTKNVNEVAPNHSASRKGNFAAYVALVILLVALVIAIIIRAIRHK